MSEPSRSNLGARPAMAPASGGRGQGSQAPQRWAAYSNTAGQRHQHSQDQFRQPPFQRGNNFAQGQTKESEEDLSWIAYTFDLSTSSWTNQTPQTRHAFAGPVLPLADHPEQVTVKLEHELNDGFHGPIGTFEKRPALWRAKQSEFEGEAERGSPHLELANSASASGGVLHPLRHWQSVPDQDLSESFRSREATASLRKRSSFDAGLDLSMISLQENDPDPDLLPCHGPAASESDKFLYSTSPHSIGDPEHLPPSASPRSMASMSPASGAAARKRNRRANANDDQSTFETGRWKSEEITLLLHIAKAFVKKDLKIIGDIAIHCGINRPSRAIDKQLKRVLQYERWVQRNLDSIVVSIDHILRDPRHKPISAKSEQLLEEARERWGVEKDVVPEKRSPPMAAPSAPPAWPTAQAGVSDSASSSSLTIPFVE